MPRVLFASSEAHPLIKTGGLADVSGSLPPVLQAQGEDVRLLLPAYRQLMAHAGPLTEVAQLQLPGTSSPVRLLEGHLPGTQVTLWLVDSPAHFDRPGGPYLGPDGRDWPDNAARFALFSRAIVAIAQGRAGLDWRADIVHCHDWQTALAPALLAREARRPGTVFTIHNLAYQGLFSWDDFAALGLPQDLWHMEAMEFHGGFSFIKGGLAFADRITTVSPTYAREICTAEFGYGLEGLLNHRAAQLSGILNGVDYHTWDPAHDRLIPRNYSSKSLARKGENKSALQRRFGLEGNSAIPLIGTVGRMVEQKGVDLILAALPELFSQQPLQVVVVGTGEQRFEQAFRGLAARHPGQVGVHVGYDESLAHLVEAGADMFLMPSRFEPCGLNQIFSLRYGTVPIVRATGGLADTVVHASDEALAAGTATGFVFEAPTVGNLAATLRQALGLFGQPRRWRQLAGTGMQQDFSWEKSARQYQALYREIIRQP